MLIHFSEAFLSLPSVNTKKRICARSIILSVQHVLQSCWLSALMETENITASASQKGRYRYVTKFVDREEGGGNRRTFKEV